MNRLYTKQTHYKGQRSPQWQIHWLNALNSNAVQIEWEILKPILLVIGEIYPHLFQYIFALLETSFYKRQS